MLDAATERVQAEMAEMAALQAELQMLKLRCEAQAITERWLREQLAECRELLVSLENWHVLKQLAAHAAGDVQ